MRLIDADALEREGWKLHRSYQQGENTMVYEMKSIQEILDKLPSAEPEQKTGWWIKDSDVAFYWKCSECGSYLFWDKEKYFLRERDEPNYCPNCGSYNGGKE